MHTGTLAYEINIRVTIAASGQGRWQEELEFPADCLGSGYTPILVVLDPTSNSKLDELVCTFEAAGGTTYIGDAAWAHLEEAAGSAMSLFLEKYVRTPIQSVLNATPQCLPDITLSMDEARLAMKVLGHECIYPRVAGNQYISDGEELLEDIDEETPGVLQPNSYQPPTPSLILTSTSGRVTPCPSSDQMSPAHLEAGLLLDGFGFEVLATGILPTSSSGMSSTSSMACAAVSRMPPVP